MVSNNDLYQSYWQYLPGKMQYHNHVYSVFLFFFVFGFVFVFCFCDDSFGFIALEGLTALCIG